MAGTLLVGLRRGGNASETMAYILTLPLAAPLQFAQILAQPPLNLIPHSLSGFPRSLRGRHPRRSRLPPFRQGVPHLPVASPINSRAITLREPPRFSKRLRCSSKRLHRRPGLPRARARMTPIRLRNHINPRLLFLPGLRAIRRSLRYFKMKSLSMDAICRWRVWRPLSVSRRTLLAPSHPPHLPLHLRIPSALLLPNRLRPPPVLPFACNLALSLLSTQSRQ